MREKSVEDCGSEGRVGVTYGRCEPAEGALVTGSSANVEPTAYLMLPHPTPNTQGSET